MDIPCGKLIKMGPPGKVENEEYVNRRQHGGMPGIDTSEQLIDLWLIFGDYNLICLTTIGTNS